MFFASDNGAGVAPEVMLALARANDGHARSYGADAGTARVQGQLRAIFEAPEAAVYLTITGTAANALAISMGCPAWGAVFCHAQSHIIQDECGAPEFYTGGAKLVPLAGAHGKIATAALAETLTRFGGHDVHSAQPGLLSLTNVTEAGTIYTTADTAALTALAKAQDLPCHLDGARFANAIAATGATPAEASWKAGIDILSFGGTKNGLMGVEAVVIFDPARAWEFELRRKRAGHLISKHRYLAAQMEAYLTDGLWLRLAAQANAMAARLARGLAGMPGVSLAHPVDANILFPEFPPGTNARAKAGGAVYDTMPGPEGREAARLVASWSSTEAEVDALLAALQT